MDFLALWNDLAPGREAEYDTWHSREHVPERVAAPGFRRGRRYVRPDHPVHRWFTLYDLESVAALETPAYRDLLANPTAWSASMRPDLRAFLRLPCIETGRAGAGFGGAVAVLRLAAAAAPLAELAALHGVVAARLGRCVAGAGFRPNDGAAPAGVLLIEALDLAAAGRAFAVARGRVAPGAEGGCYALAFVFPDAEAERAAHRRPGWPEAG